MYNDWWSDVDNLVREGHPRSLIRDSILSALEGRPCTMAKTAMDDGDGSLQCVMTALDQVYGGATSFRQLSNKLNSVTQGNGEMAKEYFKCVIQIRRKLQEFHTYMFRPGDLERQTKDAFFNGLRPEYQAMVVHRWDDPHTSITELLTAVRECEENQENTRRTQRLEYARAYPPSTTRLSYGMPQKDRQQELPRQGARYPPRQERSATNIHATNIEPILPTQEGDFMPHYVDYDNPDSKKDPELELYASFYVAAVCLADDTERRDNQCFNCKEPGHYWHNCPKPLKEEFQKMRDRLEWQEQLNGKGGPGAKGGWVPQNGPSTMTPVAAPVAPAPQ